jgi:hypothetical protein
MCHIHFGLNLVLPPLAITNPVHLAKPTPNTSLLLAMLSETLKSDPNHQDNAMPALMVTMLPFPSLSNSTVHHLVTHPPLTLLDQPVQAIDENTRHTRQHDARPDVPTTPRARQDVSLDTPEHAPAPLTPAISCPLLSPTHAPGHHLPPGHRHWLAGTL